MPRHDESSINVAEAKRRFSDLLGRVAYGGERILITRRGRPMARLVPIEEEADAEENELAGLKGWLEEGDPFFEIVEQIVTERRRHRPRILEKRTGTGVSETKKR